MESLETRSFLAADVVAGADAALVDSGDSLDTHIESTITEPLTTVDDRSQFVGPLEVDDYFASLGATSPTPTQPSPEGEGPSFPSGSAPPVMLSFSSAHQSNYWVLSGYVNDDLSPTNCVVEFGGYLQGKRVSVYADGFFSTFVPYVAGQSFTVSAVARDANGNLSNVMTTILV